MKITLALALAVLPLACTVAPAEGLGASTSAATAAPALLSFGADWSVTQTGALVPGAVATIHYDFARSPKCRAYEEGLPNWDIIVHTRVDGAAPRDVVLYGYQQPANATGADVAFEVPFGRDLAVWFENADSSLCQTWDSRYGENFHFAITPETLPVIHLRSDWTSAVDGTLAAGQPITVDYDVARLPSCRGTYDASSAWSVTMHYAFDGAGDQTADLVAAAGGQRVATAGFVAPPAGARRVTLWFENADATGCHAWDSSYGANYSFDLR